MKQNGPASSVHMNLPAAFRFKSGPYALLGKMSNFSEDAISSQSTSPSSVSSGLVVPLPLAQHDATSASPHPAESIAHRPLPSVPGDRREVPQRLEDFGATFGTEVQGSTKPLRVVSRSSPFRGGTHQPALSGSAPCVHELHMPLDAAFLDIPQVPLAPFVPPYAQPEREVDAMAPHQLNIRSRHMEDVRRSCRHGSSRLSVELRPVDV